MLLGREGECAAIDRLLDDARNGRSGALVVRGEAGIGKSALLDYAVGRSADATVLRALGVETESEFAFSGLHELLHPLLDRLGELPPVQAAALRGALALAEAQGVGRLYIGAATLSLLAAAGDDCPLLCVVDDAHWLDQASADALTFAARRLEAERVVMLFAAREPFRATGIPELVPAGLRADDAAELLAQRAARRVAPAVAEALTAATAGNPLALIGLAQELTREQLGGTEPLPHPIPLDGGLEAAFAAQAGRLSDAARRALVVAATADTRAMRVISRADAASRAALEECEEAGLLAIVDGQVRFMHPLVRSSVYQQATPAERRSAHRAIADAFGIDEKYADRRAWHAAAALVEPDEGVAEQLEIVADGARARRGHVAAAAMFERAARLTPDNEQRARRLHRAAHSAWLAGQPERALRLLEESADATGDEIRADITLLRARIELGRGVVGIAVDDLVAQAARMEGTDPGRASALLATAADAGAEPRIELARRAVALGEGAAALRANLALARALLESGETAHAAASIERARTALVGDPELRHDPELILAAVDTLAAADERDDTLGAELLSVVAAAARGHAIVILPRVLLHEAWLELQRGRWTDAYLGFAESARLADETGQGRERRAAVAGLALLDALQGREAAVAELPAGDAARILGLLELGRGAAERAVVHLEQAAANRAPSVLLRGLPPVHVDLVEACLRAGDRGRAATVAASGAWTRALLGDAAAFPEAVQEADGRPFLQARVRLNFGEALRRDGERRDAREQLRAALEQFEQLGATPWAERTEQELRASGETARRRRTTTIDELTPQELQVARLVAAGSSYKEAAAKLFLSPKTIEFHLGKVYRKLGISSGRMLAQRLTEEGLLESR